MACKINGKIPLVGLVFGERNGALILPEKDPHTQAEVDALFNTPDKIGHAQTYVECVRNRWFLVSEIGLSVQEVLSVTVLACGPDLVSVLRYVCLDSWLSWDRIKCL